MKANILKFFVVGMYSIHQLDLAQISAQAIANKPKYSCKRICEKCYYSSCLQNTLHSSSSLIVVTAPAYFRVLCTSLKLAGSRSLRCAACGVMQVPHFRAPIQDHHVFSCVEPSSWNSLLLYWCSVVFDLCSVHCPTLLNCTCLYLLNSHRCNTFGRCLNALD